MATAVVPARVPLEVREPLLQRYTSALPSAQPIHGPRPYMEPHLPRLTAVDAIALLRKHPGLVVGVRGTAVHAAQNSTAGWVIIGLMFF